jgi:glycosyltransferase involved in cell wall biosynthesis
MKIACISTSRIPSDTANSIQVMKVCHALVSQGAEVQLFVPAWPGTRPEAWPALSERYGIETPFRVTWLTANPRLKRNDFAWQAVRAARRMGADLIYTWTGQSAVLGLLNRLPVIYELHDMPSGRIGPLWFKVFLRLSGQKLLLPITQALHNRLVFCFGPIPSNAVQIAPNGVDLKPYSELPPPALARQELDLPDVKTVLCAGHLYAGRGVDLFLGLAQRFPDAVFLWVGGRPEEVEQHRQQVEKAGLANVRFTGFIDQRSLPRYLAAADVLLMPYARSIAGSSGGNSAEICSPMKMFDYLAAGRAILSSDLPVIHEVLNDSNAVFALPEDLEGWSEALARLLEDDSFRASLSQQAGMDAMAYSWAERARRALERFQK